MRDNGRNVTASRICGTVPVVRIFFLYSATAGDNVLPPVFDHDIVVVSSLSPVPSSSSSTSSSSLFFLTECSVVA